MEIADASTNLLGRQETSSDDVTLYVRLVEKNIGELQTKYGIPSFDNNHNANNHKDSKQEHVLPLPSTQFTIIEEDGM